MIHWGIVPEDEIGALPKELQQPSRVINTLIRRARRVYVMESGQQENAHDLTADVVVYHRSAASMSLLSDIVQKGDTIMLYGGSTPCLEMAGEVVSSVVGIRHVFFHKRGTFR